MSRRSSLAADLVRLFHDHFGNGTEPQVALAPGRVNLIGEHTDYNDGWALPMAIDRYVGISFGRREDRKVRVHTMAFDETAEVDLDDLTPGGDHSWVSYVAGVAWALAEEHPGVAGADLLIGGDLPIGAGVSSSAALEMATARALCEVSEVAWAPVEMARIGRKADNEFLGIGSGPLDQLASAAAREGCALLLDCRTLEVQPTEIPSRVRVVAMDTGVRRALANSEYNDRRASCERAVVALQRIDPTIQALRDAELGLLVAARSQLDEVTFQRARHVIEENERPPALASALRDERLEEAGALMNDSHASLRDLYEVSSPELDLITDLARRHPACFGARLTGAGFGGCAVALVAAEGLEEFLEDVRRGYEAKIDLPSAFFACRPVAGAHLYSHADMTEAGRE